jgi:hypothetical protein
VRLILARRGRRGQRPHWQIARAADAQTHIGGRIWATGNAGACLAVHALLPEMGRDPELEMARDAELTEPA